jgi:hypothetical protein
MKRILAIGFAALTASAAVLWLFASHRSGISPANFEKIQTGMTREQVEAILGGPPRWEVSAKRPSDQHPYCLADAFSPAEWWGRGGVITVCYNARGTVYDKTFKELPFEPKPPTLWDYVLFPAN